MLDVEKTLDALLMDGFIEQAFPILEGKGTVVLKSLDTNDELLAKQAVKAGDSVATYFVHKLTLMLAAQALRSFEYKGNKAVFQDAKQALSFLESRPPYILDEIKRVQADFEKELKSIITPEKIDENFSQTQSTATE